MIRLTDTQAYAIAIGGGTALWLGTGAIAGVREAWDATLYWTITYPLGGVLAGFLGHAVPRRAWRWGLAMMQAQALALLVTASDLGLAPLGLVLFALLAIPPIAVSMIMAGVRMRRNETG